VWLVLRAYFRDLQDHVSRLVGLIDGMRDMLTTAMQVNLALVANNQNEVVRRLAGWACVGLDGSDRYRGATGAKRIPH
jgi:magnesium transporter